MSMSPQEHYEEAERLLARIVGERDTGWSQDRLSAQEAAAYLAEAQVHATLAAGPRVTNNHYTSYSSPGALA